MRHEFASGAWIDIRPPQDLKSRDRDVWDDAHDQAMGVSARLDVGTGEADIREVSISPKLLERLPRRALLCRLLTGWSYEMSRPQWAGGIENEASFDEIPLDDWDELLALLEPYVERISRKPDPKGRPAATTTKSGSGSRTRGPAGSRPA